MTTNSNIVQFVQTNNFLIRLKSLQNLCSDTDGNYPKSLLFIAGQDGRYNKGSMTVLKYLFRGSVSKDLFDETLESFLEPLEEMVLLIQKHSISIIWSHQIKELLYPLFSTIPFLVEYLSSSKDESEMDLLQDRKCINFKRMMLSSTLPGEGVGIPVPIGYDDIMDVENWPLLQSFAIDTVFCSTGFFTARYTIADITEHVELLFRAVDGYYLENAFAVLTKSIYPHVLQSIAMLDTSTADQRMRITAEDVVGPLDIMYEFGEMNSAGTVDPTSRPVALFGADTNEFGVLNGGNYFKGWQRRLANESLHVILEGSEPSTGLRWCRTYFLKHGKCLALLKDVDSLIDDADDTMSTEHSEGKFSANIRAGSDLLDDQYSSHTNIPKELPYSKFLNRLESVYIKLWISMRWLAKIAFSKHYDALEAVSYVQRKLGLVMKGQSSIEDEYDDNIGLEMLMSNDSFGIPLQDIVLKQSEKLQIRLDCINAIGDIITIEDVDDMGGSCWVYIRAAVYGIALNDSSSSVGTVAVGDTFLFSSLSTQNKIEISSKLFNVQSTKNDSNLTPLFLPFSSDSFCVTHSLPYFRCLLGGGLEERSATRLIACTKSHH
eukprot:gene9383-12642_t